MQWSPKHNTVSMQSQKRAILMLISKITNRQRQWNINDTAAKTNAMIAKTQYSISILYRCVRKNARFWCHSQMWWIDKTMQHCRNRKKARFWYRDLTKWVAETRCNIDTFPKMRDFDTVIEFNESPKRGTALMQSPKSEIFVPWSEAMTRQNAIKDRCKREIASRLC